MGDRTNIGYLDSTWSPVKGCDRQSIGCKNCWAERQAARFCKEGEHFHGLTVNGRWTGDIKFYPKELAKPIRWKRPRSIGVCFMGDLFHENAYWKHRAAVFAAMALAPQHIFLVLTKRPWAIEHFFGFLGMQAQQADVSPLQLCCDVAYELTGDEQFKHAPEGLSLPLENVWVGASIENQKTADKRIRALVGVPAAHLWVSAEPLLEPVSLEAIVMPAYDNGSLNALTGELWPALGDADEEAANVLHLPHLELVVVGGESGPHARDMAPDIARDLRDECKYAQVPFYFKQMARRGPIPDDLMVRELPYTEPKGTNDDSARRRGDGP